MSTDLDALERFIQGLHRDTPSRNEVLTLITEHRALLEDRTILTIDCPLCGVSVPLVSSATLSLSLSQHVQWVCEKAKAQQAEIARLTERVNYFAGESQSKDEEVIRAAMKGQR